MTQKTDYNKNVALTLMKIFYSIGPPALKLTKKGFKSSYDPSAKSLFHFEKKIYYIFEMEDV